MSRIQTDRVLPPELSIQSIDDILYSIGLCHHSVRERPKRSFINHPLLIAIVMVLQIVMRTISNTTDNKTILILTADSCHYLTIKEYVNTMSTLLSLMALFSQMVYFYNHRIGVKPTFVRVFQVLSGSITPLSVGLNHSTQVNQLLKIAKWLPLLQENNKFLIPFSTFLFVFGIYFYSLDFISAVILSAFPIAFQCLWTYYAVNSLSVQIFVFNILCKYFLIKLKALNRSLKEEKRINSNTIRNILHEYSALVKEIDDYNTTYWSKFLLIIWSLLGILNVFLFYVIIFIMTPIVIRITMIYFFILYCIMFLFILSIASFVNLETNSSYKLFNTLNIKFSKSSKLDKRRMTMNQMKVILFHHYNIFIRLCTLYSA